ncbi:MAG: hypothetical protein JNG84_14885, partial [Archangium sp.]|nr:hypothetical protein [Archangium sp.]
QVGGMGRSALAATDDSFIAIFIRPNTNEVELYQRFLDGGSTSHTYANTSAVETVAIAGAGTRWAATWATGLQTSAPGVKCVTSSAAASVSAVSSDVAVDVVSIDVTPSGQVGIAARSSNENVTPRAGISTTGCPAQLVEFRDPALTTQASGVAMVATADGQSFRVISTGPLNGGSGVVSITAPKPGGGAIGVARILQGEALWDVSAAMGGGGNWALATYDRDLEDGGSALAVKPLPVNIASDTEILIDSVTLLPWARTWNMGRCGPGCMSVAMTPTRGALVLSVTFISDDDEMRPLGAQHYDVACSRSPNALGASVATVGDTVGVFYSDQSQGQLFLCDKPPF